MNDKYLSEHFKSDFWDVIRVGKKLYLQLEKGSHKAIHEYATEEFAEANYIDLIGVIKEYKAITAGSIPKIVEVKEGGCLLVWEYQNEEEWEESTDLLTISIPHLTVQWSGEGVTLYPCNVKAEDLKEKFGPFPENSDESGRAAAIRAQEEVHKKQIEELSFADLELRVVATMLAQSESETDREKKASQGASIYKSAVADMEKSWDQALGAAHEKIKNEFERNEFERYEYLLKNPDAADREFSADLWAKVDANWKKKFGSFAGSTRRYEKQNTDISGDHFFHGNQWFLYLQANRLYIGRQRGDRVVVCSYLSANLAKCRWLSLSAILSDRAWIVEADFPDIEKDENGDVLLTWADPERGWYYHLTVNATRAVVVGENSDESGRLASIQAQASALAKFQALCHYATPRELCWHDGKRIEIRPGYADMYRVNPVEFNAVAKRNEELQEAALRELRRLSHCVFREWPTCSVSGEPVALTLRPFDFKTTSVVHGALICRHCNKDYQP